MPETPQIAYKWKEIADLPADSEPLRDRELEALFEAWLAEKDRFEEPGVRAFSNRLNREWAIETGVIEGVYQLDRGVTQTLIDRGIDSSFIPHYGSDRDPELVAQMIQAHAEVLEGLFDFGKGQRTLTVGYIKEMHAALLRHQRTVTVIDQFKQHHEVELLKGEYKRHPNNPVRPNGELHEYCPPEHVASEMDRLIATHERHRNASVPTHAEAAWLHHAFTQIHPFQDGNGRVARALASLIFIKSGYFPLVVNRDDWKRYIAALETADTGMFSPLASFFAQNQKRSLTRAIGHAAEVTPASTVDEALLLTRDLLVKTGRIVPLQYRKAVEIVVRLQALAQPRLQQVAARLTGEISKADTRFQFDTTILNTPGPEEFRPLAEALHYDPNFKDYFLGAVLTLSENAKISSIGILFQSVGPAFRGLLVAASYFTGPGKPPIPVCDDLFRISYNENAEDVVQRFRPWLEDSLIRGLAEWRKTLV